MNFEPGLNSFSIHVTDWPSARDVLVPIHFDEYVIAATDFDLTQDSYSFKNRDLGTETCFGMAVTSILHFEDARPTYELGKDEAKDEILRYQFDARNKIIALDLLPPTHPNEEREYEKLKEYVMQNDPVVLAVHWGILDMHAVVAYKIVESADKAYIMCYDNEYICKSLSDDSISAFAYATYDLATHEFYYLGSKMEFLVYRPIKEYLALQVPEAKFSSWGEQVAYQIKSGVTLIFACPVNITITDQYNRVISDNGTNQIPDAIFASANETKYFCLPFDFAYNVCITAYGAGDFDLTIANLLVGGSVSLDIYEGVLVRSGTLATVEVELGQVNETMRIDNDGDGVIDELRSPTVSETIYIPMPVLYTFSVVWGEETFIVAVESNSTVFDFTFNRLSKEISFGVTGEAGTNGFCNVTIPKALLYGEPWTVLIDGAPVPATITENATHSCLHFTFSHSTHAIQALGTWVIGSLPDTDPPLVGTPSQEPEPYKVTPSQAVGVSVSVTDMESGVKNVTLFYSASDGVFWSSLAMFYNTAAGLYQATIPAFPSGTNICYRIVAYDNAGNVAMNDNAGQYYCYTVNQPAFPGDLNYDGIVNIFDVLIVATSYGSKAGELAWNPEADLAAPYGRIDIFDLVTVIAHYGERTP